MREGNTRPSHRQLLSAIFATGLLAGGTVCGAQQNTLSSSRGAAIDFPTVLYGAAYYNEYMPEQRPGQQPRDVLISVIRAMLRYVGINIF